MKKPPTFLQWQEKPPREKIKGAFSQKWKKELFYNLYRHNKAPHSYYVKRQDCLTAMRKTGARGIQAYIDGRWQNIKLDYLEIRFIKKGF